MVQDTLGADEDDLLHILNMQLWLQAMRPHQGPALLREGIHHLALVSSLFAALDSPCQSSLLVWSSLAR